MIERFRRRRRLHDFLEAHGIPRAQTPRSLRGLTTDGRFVFVCQSADGHPVAVLREWPEYGADSTQFLRKMAREAGDLAAGWQMFPGRPTPNRSTRRP